MWVSDLFNVLSGFLITGLLLREAERTGSIDFLDFYARRLKSLAPVYLVVLAATLAFMVLFLPPLYRAQFTPDLVGASLYVATVVFAGHRLGLGANLTLAAASILLAWLSHGTIEESFQHMVVDGRRAVVFSTSLMLSTALVVATNSSASAGRRAMEDQTTSTRIPALEERLQQAPSTLLARHANGSVSATGQVIGPGQLMPSLDILESDLTTVQTNGCSGNVRAAQTARCWGGDPRGRPGHGAAGRLPREPLVAGLRRHRPQGWLPGTGPDPQCLHGQRPA